MKLHARPIDTSDSPLLLSLFIRPSPVYTYVSFPHRRNDRLASASATAFSRASERWIFNRSIQASKTNKIYSKIGTLEPRIYRLPEIYIHAHTVFSRTTAYSLKLY